MTETNQTPDETGKGLRAQLEKTLAKNKVLEAREMNRSFSALGLSLDSGLGKAVAKEYEGEITTEAIAEYAKEEYGYEYVPEPAGHPQAGVIAQGQAQVDAASQGAGSVPVTPTQAESLAEAEAKGDYAATMAIKSQQVADMFRP